MDKFLNKKYKLDRVENFDEFFIEMGKEKGSSKNVV